jgi:hypothetical protein
MLELVPRMKQYFDTMQDRLYCFCELGFQSEGWFKGELLTLFSQLRREGKIQELDREVKVGANKVDVKIRPNDTNHWIELKHWLIGAQKGVNYGPNFYFGDPTSVGIIRDVDKLNALSGHRWMLLLLTANPGLNAWESGVERFNRKFAPRQLESRTQPDMFPPSYFLGLLDLGAKLEA